MTLFIMCSCDGEKKHFFGGTPSSPSPIEMKDFHASLDIAKNGDNFVFTVKLKQAGKKSRFLHVENPMASINLVYIHNSEEVREISQTSISLGDFTGIILDPISEYSYKFEFESLTNGSLYNDKWDITLPVYEEKLEIWARLHLRVADYGSKQCDVIEVNTNSIRINFPYPPRVYSAPEKELPKNLKLPDLK